MVAADSTDDDRNHYSVVCIYRVEKRKDNEKSRKKKATKNNLLLVGQKWNIPPYHERHSNLMSSVLKNLKRKNRKTDKKYMIRRFLLCK